MESPRASMGYLFATFVFYLLLLSDFCQAYRHRPAHPLRGHGGADLPPLPRLTKNFQNYRKAGVNGSACVESPPADVRAPKTNVWAQLGYDEVVQVREFMFDQKGLNLSTAGYAYYGYGYGSSTTSRFLGTIELNTPNKTEVLPYLDGNGTLPLRYAKTQLITSSENFTEYQEIIIGPIPVTEKTTYQPLGYPYSRKNGSFIEYYEEYHYHPVEMYARQVKKDAQDVFQALWPYLNHTWEFGNYGIDLPMQNGNTEIWLTPWTYQQTDDYGVGAGFPLGLYLGIEQDKQDFKKCSLIGWIYNETLYETTQELRNAVKSGEIPVPPQTIAGVWSRGGHHGEVLPMDIMAPPQAVAPAGSRFSLDENMKYVQWMGFSFYMGFQVNRGWGFYDIRHKGQRILYELSLQEALAHYAGTDPSESTTWYFDGSIGMGGAIVELVPGYDCPTYSRYWDTHVSYGNEKPSFKKNTICFFEFDGDYPIARHSANYVAARKNIYFVVRSVYTVGNYDYMLSYYFYLEGSIKISVRASGYIAGQSAVGNHDYGYDVHGELSGGMHDHSLQFKADFDILGTANTMQLTSFVPANEKYLWSDTPRETLKLSRKFVESEDDSRFNWDRATQYTVYNTDQPNEWGEYRGYRIMPADGTTHFTNKKSTNAKNLIHPFTFDLGVTQFHDTEPQSVYPQDYLSNNIENPMINFDDFFNGESLVQEDLVTWINLGMHHLPHTGDMPLTLFTVAHAEVQFSPLNYYKDDISTQSLSQVQINFGGYKSNYSVADVNTYGQNPAFCSIDLAKDSPDLYNFKQSYGYK